MTAISLGGGELPITEQTRTGIIALSVAMLGEAPGTERLGDWVSRADGGMTLEDLANHIAASGAFQAMYPSYLTNQEFASAFLGNVLGSENVSAGLMSAAVEIVVGLLNDGMTRGALGLAVVHALLEINAQGAAHPAHGDLGGVAAQLANKVAVAEHYTINARMADPSSDVLDSVTSDAATADKAIHDIDSPPADAMFDEVGELSIMENTTSGSVGSVTASDPNSTAMYPEPVTYSLKDAPDGFSIDAASGEISYVGDGLDYETTPTVDLTVVATSTGADGMATGVEKMVTVMVGDSSELGPVFSDEIGEFALYEHADGSEEPIGVGTITASDGDGDTVSYSIKDDPEDWAILEDGKLCYIGDGIDYEEMSSVDLTIVATSLGANGEDESVEQKITVMVHDRSDAVFGEPDLTFLNERTSGADEAITLGSVAATDADGDDVSYRLTGPAVDSDNVAILHTGFAIDDNGVITYSGPGIHHSTTQSVDLTVIATSLGDNGEDTEVEMTVSIAIQARADAMFDEVGDLALDENADGSGDGNAIGVGYVTASDANRDTIAYSIKDNPDDWAILEDGKLCYVGSGVDYEEMSSVDLTIVASSTGANGLPTAMEQSVTVSINNLNDNAPSAVSDLAGTGTIHAMMLEADTPTGYTFTVEDADGSAGMYTATVYEGEGDDMAVSTRFAAVQDEDDPLSFSLVAAAGTDFEAGDVSLTIKVSDGGMDDEGEPTSAMNMVNFTVPDAPPPPPKEGEDFVLTLGIDRLTGTADNDTFIADQNAATGSLFALGSLDRIDGGDGDDTLQVFRLGNFALPATATLRNVETLEISATGSVKATVSPFSGVKTIELAVVGNESVDPSGDTTDADRGTGAGTAVDDFDLALDLNAGGAAVTAGMIDGVICVRNASTVDILEASATSVVKIGSNGSTTSVNVKGGASVDVGEAFGAGTPPAVTGASETVASVAIDGVAGAASLDFNDPADDTDDGSIRIVSKAIESVSLANTYGNARITNGSSDAEDLALTVNKYGGQKYDTNNDGTLDGTRIAEVSLDGSGAAENVSIAVEGASNLKLRNDATETVSISGSEALTLQVNKADDSVSDTVESISVMGDAGLTFVANVHSSLESIDASGSMGKNNLTITDAADLETISTGGGDDTILVTAAAKLESISTGGGKDKVTVNSAHPSDGLAVDLGAGDDTYTVGTGTFSAKSTVMGGAGTDVLAMTTGADSTTHVAANGNSIYSGFEVLAVGGGSGDYDLEKLGIRTVVAAGVDTSAAVNLKNAAAGTTVTVDGTGAGASPGRSATIVYELKDASGKSDSMTVNLMAKGGKDDAPAGPGGNPAAVTTGETTLALTADGVETVVINSSVTAGGKQMASAYTNTVTLQTTTSSIKTLDVNGAGKTSVNADAITTLTMVDATGNSAGVTASATGAVAAVTFNGGSGGDNFTGGGQRDIMNGGGGKDTLNGGTEADIITGGAGGDTLTGGAGNDSFRFTSASDSRVSFGKGGAASGFDMITDFAAGDVIALSRGLGVTDTDLSGGTAILSKAAIADTDTPANAVDDLMDYIGDGANFFSDGVDDKAIAHASDGTHGYVFIDVNGNGDFDVATDMVIRLDNVNTVVTGADFDIV